MPRAVPPEVLDKLAETIARNTEGIGIDALSHSLRPRVPRRTLQRRLFAFVEADRILTEGKGRAIKYRISPIIGEVHATLPLLEVEGVLESYVPRESEEIKAYVRQPPTSVRLNLYEGNITRYGLKLPEYLAWRKRVSAHANRRILSPANRRSTKHQAASFACRARPLKSS